MSPLNRPVGYPGHRHHHSHQPHPHRDQQQPPHGSHPSPRPTAESPALAYNPYYGGPEALPYTSPSYTYRSPSETSIRLQPPHQLTSATTLSRFSAHPPGHRQQATHPSPPHPAYSIHRASPRARTTQRPSPIFSHHRNPTAASSSPTMPRGSPHQPPPPLSSSAYPPMYSYGIRPSSESARGMGDLLPALRMGGGGYEVGGPRAYPRQPSPHSTAPAHIAAGAATHNTHTTSSSSSPPVRLGESGPRFSPSTGLSQPVRRDSAPAPMGSGGSSGPGPNFAIAHFNSPGTPSLLSRSRSPGGSGADGSGSRSSKGKLSVTAQGPVGGEPAPSTASAMVVVDNFSDVPLAKQPLPEEKTIKLWPEYSVRLLLSLRKRLSAQFARMARNNTLWVQIADTLLEQNIDRTANQCLYKWKNLSRAYNQCVTQNATLPPDQHRYSPFYNEIKEINDLDEAHRRNDQQPPRPRITGFVMEGPAKTGGTSSSTGGSSSSSNMKATRAADALIKLNASDRSVSPFFPSDAQPTPPPFQTTAAAAMVADRSTTGKEDPSLGEIDSHHPHLSTNVRTKRVFEDRDDSSSSDYGLLSPRRPHQLRRLSGNRPTRSESLDSASPPAATTTAAALPSLHSIVASSPSTTPYYPGSNLDSALLRPTPLGKSRTSPTLTAEWRADPDDLMDPDHPVLGLLRAAGGATMSSESSEPRAGLGGGDGHHRRVYSPGISSGSGSDGSSNSSKRARLDRLSHSEPSSPRERGMSPLDAQGPLSAPLLSPPPQLPALQQHQQTEQRDSTHTSSKEPLGIQLQRLEGKIHKVHGMLQQGQELQYQWMRLYRKACEGIDEISADCAELKAEINHRL
ncbi:hypothetical protein H4R33_000643 [Dimargaris cristalligena]|nr:hypothetical protein H4R33_000643 [Dimargaris cristalligena]